MEPVDPAVRADLAPTGALRASINLGNPVLASGSPEAPSGITVALAREVAARLGVDVELQCYGAARDSVAAVAEGRADVGFLAVDPGRPLQFTAPYVLIEGVYVVAVDTPLATAPDVDADGVRVGVKEGSAYDLHLTRTLTHATVERGAEGIDTFVARALEVGAGIRQPMTAWVDAHPGHRILEPAFMQIRQAVAVPEERAADSVAWLRDVVDALVASGWVAAALTDAGQDPALAAG
ncbi:transporter substrate-binding domain-containing protein [Nocardioides sp. Soil805]|uniref:transporter substrate-binding domain-containing protein n=1 Tax=Nocardioides sp. Soil805 TaxID=1736416 RepID=UPI0007025F08|nr:transporter substrate-binding domain-containing protein [Nocardioides sp. Soil805]KRF32336.1 ABC transporter substrate-binding protein [Nocardioides sp. Soil805]